MNICIALLYVFLCFLYVSNGFTMFPVCNAIALHVHIQRIQYWIDHREKSWRLRSTPIGIPWNHILAKRMRCAHALEAWCRFPWAMMLAQPYSGPSDVRLLGLELPSLHFLLHSQCWSVRLRPDLVWVSQGQRPPVALIEESFRSNTHLDVGSLGSWHPICDWIYTSSSHLTSSPLSELQLEMWGEIY